MSGSGSNSSSSSSSGGGDGSRGANHTPGHSVAAAAAHPWCCRPGSLRSCSSTAAAAWRPCTGSTCSHRREQEGCCQSGTLRVKCAGTSSGEAERSATPASSMLSAARPRPPAAHQLKKSCSAVPCVKRSCGRCATRLSICASTAAQGRSSSTPPLIFSSAVRCLQRKSASKQGPCHALLQVGRARPASLAAQEHSPAAYTTRPSCAGPHLLSHLDWSHTAANSVGMPKSGPSVPVTATSASTSSTLWYCVSPSARSLIQLRPYLRGGAEVGGLFSCSSYMQQQQQQQRRRRHTWHTCRCCTRAILTMPEANTGRARPLQSAAHRGS